VDAACLADLAAAAFPATHAAADPARAAVIRSVAPARAAALAAAVFLAVPVVVLVESVGQELVSQASRVTPVFQRSPVAAGAAAVSSLAIAH
jgi:hypothetical protein